MFILRVTHNTLGNHLELAGVVWDLALAFGEGGRDALVGALAWLGVRLVPSQLPLHPGPWLFVGFALPLGSWFGFVGTS